MPTTDSITRKIQGAEPGERPPGAGINENVFKLLRIQTHVEAQPHLAQDRLDLVERLLAEVVFRSSASLFWTRSAIVRMLALFTQFEARTESVSRAQLERSFDD